MDTSRTNPSTASSNIRNDEWQTAKGKSTKAKPKSIQQQTSVENNLMNGHGAGNGYQPNENSVTGNQNGYANGGNNRRVMRQSSAGSGSGGGSGRPNQYQTSNSQHSRPTSSKEDAMSKRKLLEKEAKNISKHDATVERANRLFDEEIEKSRIRIRHTFDELRNCLIDRERLMLEELERCKKEGVQLLHRQGVRAKELKDGVVHLSTMSDRQVDDLRNQIRRFMSERHFEEELSGTMRFRCETDRLIPLIKNFGEVVPIGANSNGGGGNVEAQPQKHSSMSSLVSSIDGGDGAHSGINNKSVSEIAFGGIMMKSDSMDADQLVELTRNIRENLKLQGIAEDILPEVSGATAMMPARRRPPPSNERSSNGGRGSGGGGQRNGRR